MKYIFTLLFLAAFSITHAQIKFTFGWRQISGPVTVTIVHPDSASTPVTGLDKEGFYDFEFSACNDFGCGYDTCRVTVIGSVLSLDTTKPYELSRPEFKEFEVALIDKNSLIYFEIKSPRAQTVKVNIFNTAGQMLATADINVRKGYNYGTLPKPRVHGIYIIVFYTYFEKTVKKIYL